MILLGVSLKSIQIWSWIPLALALFALSLGRACSLLSGAARALSIKPVVSYIWLCSF